MMNILKQKVKNEVDFPLTSFNFPKVIESYEDAHCIWVIFENVE